MNVRPAEFKEMTDIPMQIAERSTRTTVADQIFDELYQNVISLKLPPGAKISEAEIAKTMDVSRQPVRDAFFRLKNLGFLEIRPQRATTVSKISENAVMQARFIRTALEIETIRVACEKFTDEDMDAIAAILDRQRRALDTQEKLLFHQLDDLFHWQICERSGLGFIWKLIQENKAHMDRVRYLSLSFASDKVYDDHMKIFNGLKNRDPDIAIEHMREHLSTILSHFDRIRDMHLMYFDTDA